MKPIGISHVGTLLSTRQDAAINTRNGLIKDKVTNEKGFSMTSDKIPYKFLGKIETDDNPIIFSGDQEFSAIGVLDSNTGEYTKILDDKELNYKLTFGEFNFIQGEFRRNYLNQMEIVWVQSGTKPRFLNLENPLPSSLELYDLSLYAARPNIELNVTEGGSLEKGAYYVTIRLISQDEASTNTFTPEGPVFVYNEKPTSGVMAPSNMSLNIKVTNLDTNFSRVRLVIIKNVNGVVSVIETEEFPIGDGVLNYTHSTNSRGTAITLEETLIPEAFYTEAAAITQIDDTLYLAGVKEEEETPLQAYFNQASVKWVSQLVDIEDADLKTGKKRTFKHGEVYALYGVVRWRNGRKSKAFHIPGPEESYSIVESRELANNKKVKYKSTLEGSWELDGTNEGFTAGWKNINETYPREAYYGALQGTKVRHHRMPTVKFCKDKIYSEEESYGVSKLDVLGIKVEGISFPSEIQEQVDYIEIYYAKRDYGNSLVLSQGAMLHSSVGLNVWTTLQSNVVDANRVVKERFEEAYKTSKSFGTPLFFNGSSLMYNTEREEPRFYWIAPFSMVNAIHTPETIKDRFIVSGTPIIQIQGWLKSYPVTDNTGGGASFRSGKRTVMDHLKISTWEKSNSRLIFGESADYLINGENEGAVNNNKSEAKLVLSTIEYHLEAESRWKDFVASKGTLAKNIPEFIAIVDILGTSNRDLYSGFTSQALVRAGDDRDVIWGGDTFICKFAFNTMGVGEAELIEWEVNEDKTPIDNKTNQFYRQLIVESSKNLWLRYVDVQNPLDKYFGGNIKNTPTSRNIPFQDGDEPNTISLPLGNNALAELLDGIRVFNPWDKDVTSNPFKVVRSRRQSREGKRNSWRVFLALDYFETVKNKGVITNIEGYDGNLFIHHEHALFRTANKTTLSGDILSVTLGTGDIFKLEPQESKASKTGVAGLQHPLYSLVTDLGYIFFDSEMGNLFLANEKGLSVLNGELDPTIKQVAKNIKGSPYTTGRGVVIGHDPEENRILVSFLPLHDRLTLSLDIGSMRWASSHDYFPQAYISTREKLYNIHDNKVYMFNAGAPGVYHTDTLFPYIQDIAFVKGHSFIVDNVNWRSTVRENDSTVPFPKEIENSTWSSIALYSSDTCSGEIALNPKSFYRARASHNVARAEDRWNFNKFDDISKEESPIGTFLNSFPIDESKLNHNSPWYKRGKIRGDIVVVKLIYNNVSGNRIVLDDIDIKLTPLSR